MAIFKAVASAALLLLASAGQSDAFTTTSYRARTSCLFSTPCEAPEGVDAVKLQDASPLRNAMVTNIDGELVQLGDAMVSTGLSEKTFDTSVVVFLRHMG